MPSQKHDIQNKRPPSSQDPALRTNQLGEEESLYLRQHAQQPVAWRPWRREYIEWAQKHDRPLFISIGYSACHWCHVMARESFEDEEIACLLNENFLPLKVDREEHPEVDTPYILACELVTGRAGWPLTILALPDGRPFFLATYLPKEGHGQRIGLKEVLLHTLKYWRKNRKALENTAQEITKALKNIPFYRPDTFAQGSVLHQAAEELLNAYDREYGGFGIAPKFPLPFRLLFLLRLGQKYHRQELLELVKDNLWRMRFAGIFDQVGLGFHRYAIDRAWRIPHFEKMLYDQALLLYLYSEAASTLDEPFFAQVAREIITYLEEALKGPEGGFFCAESAESQGKEGAFYTWSLEELASLLSEEEFFLAQTYFGLKQEGNFLEEGKGRPNGQNILHPQTTPWRFARQIGREDFAKKLASILSKLKAARQNRPRPPRDEKILTDWNGLLVAGLAKAARALGAARALSLAQETFAYLWEHHRTEDYLFHLHLKKGIEGLLEDYVYLAWGALELYETTRDPSYQRALSWLWERLEALFATPQGLFQQVGRNRRPFLFRVFPIYDGALPSGNGLLAYIFSQTGQKAQARQILSALGGYLKETPSNFPTLLLALLHL